MHHDVYDLTFLKDDSISTEGAIRIGVVRSDQKSEIHNYSNYGGKFLG